jgi:hypothetical protein
LRLCTLCSLISEVAQATRKCGATVSLRLHNSWHHFGQPQCAGRPYQAAREQKAARPELSVPEEATATAFVALIRPAALRAITVSRSRAPPAHSQGLVGHAMDLGSRATTSLAAPCSGNAVLSSIATPITCTNMLGISQNPYSCTHHRFVP